MGYKKSTEAQTQDRVYLIDSLLKMCATTQKVRSEAFMVMKIRVPL